MEKASRDINGAAKFFLGLSMVCVALTIVSSCINIQNNKYFGWDTSILIKEIVLDILILFASALTFSKIRIGLYSLVALFIIRIFATIPQGGIQSIAGKLGANFVPFVRDFGPFAIAMCFRKNGISGWTAMRLTEKHHTKKSSSTSCIDENIKVRKDQESFLVGEKDDSPKTPSLQKNNTEEPLIDNGSATREKTIMSNESLPVLTDQHKDRIVETTSKELLPKEMTETEQDTCAESSEKNRIKELEEENSLLKQMYAELALQASRKKE